MKFTEEQLINGINDEVITAGIIKEKNYNKSR